MTKVLVNGAFDILHSGHINLLKYAKYVGDYLIVALDTDERIKEAKEAAAKARREAMLRQQEMIDSIKLAAGIGFMVALGVGFLIFLLTIV